MRESAGKITGGASGQPPTFLGRLGGILDSSLSVLLLGSLQQQAKWFATAEADRALLTFYFPQQQVADAFAQLTTATNNLDIQLYAFNRLMASTWMRSPNPPRPSRYNCTP